MWIAAALSLTIAPSFAFTDLGITSKFDSSEAKYINDEGVIVGTFADNLRQFRAFSWKQRVLKVLPKYPGFDSTSATGINNEGIIAINASSEINGAYMGTKSLALMLDKGKWTPIPPPKGYTDSHINGINNQGVAFGVFDFSSAIPNIDHPQVQLPEAFILSRGKLSLLGTGEVMAWNGFNVGVGRLIPTVMTGAGDSFQAISWKDGTRSSLSNGAAALGINDTGLKVGYLAMNGIPVQAVTFTDGKADKLPTAGSPSCANAVNLGEDIVGWSVFDGKRLACIWQDDICYDLNALVKLPTGWTLLDARSINKKGQIVGVAMSPAGQRAFLLTPR